MIKPPKLKSNATIGIINPSYWLDEEKFNRTAKIFTDRGFNIARGKSTYLKSNLFGGTPEDRAQDIMDMFVNPDIDAIICARGGYGANRVLPLLNYDVIKAHPKIFMGYSDITAFNTSITQNTGLVTFHGPMLVTFSDGYVEYDFSHLIKTLSGNSPHIISSPNELPAKILKSGIAEGPLWGGNLCLLLNRLGTLDQLDTNGAILFIEDIGEKLYRFDRMMYHMKTAGMFENIKGLIIGELVAMEDTNPPFGKTSNEIVMDVCGDLDIPIVTNFPCGHGKYQATMPISIPVELNTNGELPTLTLMESPVI